MKKVKQMNWYLNVIKNYATFEGRARRKEYWMFTLVHFIVIFLLSFVDVVIGSFDDNSGIGILASFYILLTLIPSLAVTIRRLHDTGRSGWWLLTYFVPIIGPITILIFTVLDSTLTSNKYGDTPKIKE